MKILNLLNNCNNKNPAKFIFKEKAGTEPTYNSKNKGFNKFLEKIENFWKHSVLKIIAPKKNKQENAKYTELKNFLETNKDNFSMILLEIKYKLSEQIIKKVGNLPTLKITSPDETESLLTIKKNNEEYDIIIGKHIYKIKGTR